MQYKDFDQYEIYDDGRIFSRTTNKFLKLKKARHGYIQTTLTKNKVHYGFSVHRLVAECYIPNPDNLETVDHINENKADNRVSNLRWMTRRENTTRSVSRAVICIETGVVYPNAVDAQMRTGVCCTTIRRVCGNIKYRKTAGGFHWKFI